MKIAAGARNSPFVTGVKDKTTQLTFIVGCTLWPPTLASAIGPFSTSVGRNTYIECTLTFYRTYLPRGELSSKAVKRLPTAPSMRIAACIGRGRRGTNMTRTKF